MQIWSKFAHAVVDSLQRGEIMPSRVLGSLKNRVSEINPVLNALPTTCFGRAEQAVARLETRTSLERGVLAGLPIPIKDSYEVDGVRTTWGSLAFADHVAKRSNYWLRRSK